MLFRSNREVLLPQIQVDFVDVNGNCVSNVDAAQYLYLSGGIIDMPIDGGTSFYAHIRIKNKGTLGSILNVKNIVKLPDNSYYFIKRSEITPIISDDISYLDVEIYFGAGVSPGIYTVGINIYHDGVTPGWGSPFGFFITTTVE